MAMTKIFERLFLGDAHDADRLAVTNPEDITAVVNVSTQMHQHWRDGTTYVYFYLHENERIDARRFERIMIRIAKLIRAGTVLVHCSAGSSRSPVVVATYLHVVGYKNFDAALSEQLGGRLGRLGLADDLHLQIFQRTLDESVAATGQAGLAQ